MKKVLRTSRDTTKNAPCLRRSHTIRCSVRIYSAILRLFIYISIQHVPKTQTSLCCPQTTTQGGSHSMTCTIPLTSLTNHTANIVYNLFIRVWENITHNPSLSLSLYLNFSVPIFMTMRGIWVPDIFMPISIEYIRPSTSMRCNIKYPCCPVRPLSSLWQCTKCKYTKINCENCAKLPFV